GFRSFEGGLKSETANGYLRAGIVAVGAACPLQSARFGMNVPLFTRHLARLTFVAFLLTFIAARTLVILIMTRKGLDLYVHFVGIVLLIALVSFGMLLIKSLSHANDKIRPRLLEMEKSGPN